MIEKIEENVNIFQILVGRSINQDQERTPAAMILRYKVKESEYDQFLQIRQKRQMNTPMNRFFTLVLVLMPLCALAFAAANGLMTGVPLAILAVVAVALSVCNFIVRTRYWSGSSRSLQVIKDRNGITKDFWLEHRVRVDEEGFFLTCGSYHAEYTWPCFGGFDEIDDMLIPIFNAAPADIIPASAIEAFGGKEAFLTTFTDQAKVAARKGMDFTPPEDARLRLDYRYDQDAYLRDQRDARRKRFTTKLIFNRVLYAKLMITSVLVYASTAADSLGMIALYTALILLCDYEYYSTFTPLLLGRLRKEIRPITLLHPDQRASLYVTERGISIRGDIHAMDIPFQYITAIRRSKHAAILYLADQTMLTVPAPPATDGEAFEAFLSVLTQKARR